jgi:AcrR family transcriptional regulator
MSTRPDLSRPRSVRAHDAVIEATRALLDKGGLPAATIDSISRRSGVSKATIYNHWPSRLAIAAEAFGQQMAQAIPLPATGSAATDLAQQVQRVSAFYAGEHGAVFAQLLAASVADPHGAEYFRDFFLAGRREAIRELWQRGIESGELRGDIDVEVAIDLLFGPLIFRLMSRHAPLSPADAGAIADGALHGLLAGR